MGIRSVLFTDEYPKENKESKDESVSDGKRRKAMSHMVNVS